MGFVDIWVSSLQHKVYVGDHLLGEWYPLSAGMGRHNALLLDEVHACALRLLSTLQVLADQGHVCIDAADWQCLFRSRQRWAVSLLWCASLRRSQHLSSCFHGCLS